MRKRSAPPRTPPEEEGRRGRGTASAAEEEAASARGRRPLADRRRGHRGMRLVSFLVTLVSMGTRGLPESQEGLGIKVGSLIFGLGVSLVLMAVGLVGVKNRVAYGRWGDEVHGHLRRHPQHVRHAPGGLPGRVHPLRTALHRAARPLRSSPPQPSLVAPLDERFQGVELGQPQAVVNLGGVAVAVLGGAAGTRGGRCRRGTWPGPFATGGGRSPASCAPGRPG